MNDSCLDDVRKLERSWSDGVQVEVGDILVAVTLRY